jgi:threonine/homoserine/homoserine lactone efflux protein
MNANVLIPFFIGMMILAATPGPGVFGTIAKAITQGFKTSLFFIGGLVLGDIIFLTLALLGLSAIAKMLGELFLGVKIAGGLYLVYLGVKMFRNSRIKTDIAAKNEEDNWQTCLSGLLLTLGNPKPILFYASVLPTIINFNDVTFTDAVLMMTLIAIVSFSVLGMYGYIASISKKMGMSGNMQTRTNQAGGVIMMIVGIYVIL